MRKSYETTASRRAEEAVGRVVAKRIGLEVRQMPLKYPVDFAFAAGTEVRAFAEIKCREHHFGAFPTLILGLNKWAACRRLSEFSGVPALLVVRFGSEIRWCRMPDHGLDVRIGGREDRGDWQDVEPVVHVPVRIFEQLDKLAL